jgi:hypothetical protein
MSDPEITPVDGSEPNTQALLMRLTNKVNELIVIVQTLKNDVQEAARLAITARNVADRRSVIVTIATMVAGGVLTLLVLGAVAYFRK